jgi:Fic family protein
MPTFHVRRQTNAQTLMQSLYQSPVTTIKMVTNLIQAETNTAAALIDDFVKLGILKEFTGQRRNRLFIFDDYVRLFKR